MAYLDPASWAVGSQLVIGAGAWAWLHIRRVLRGIGLGRPPTPQPPKGVREVEALTAIELLSVYETLPRLVLVIEGPRDWPYLASVAKQLLDDGLDIWCISAGDVPLDGLESLNIPIRYVTNPSRAAWGLLLSSLHSELVITTLTDLGSTQFPKSPDAYYGYVFHSLVSTHVAYPENAFDGYDSLFCPGAYQVYELNMRDRMLGRAPRTIVAAGYPFLDDLCLRLEGAPKADNDSIVLAPSWSSDDQLAGLWTDIASALRKAGWRCSLRPHPETIKRSPAVLDRIAAQFGSDPYFTLDRGAETGNSFAMYAGMVTDWSGAAIEFALAGCGPVAFVNTPRKVRNHHWQEISLDSVEIQVRECLGIVIQPGEALTLPCHFGTPGSPLDRLNRETVDVWTVNHGNAASVIAEALRPQLTVSR